MKSGVFMLALALSGVGCWAAADAGAAGISQLTGTRLSDGVVMSFVPEKGMSAESPELRFYIDSDSKTSTGFKIDGIGAEYRYEAGKLYCYTGDGESGDWDAVEDAKIVKATRKGRHIVFLGNQTLELSGVAPVKVAVRLGDGNSARKVGELNIRWPKTGSEKLTVRMSDNGRGMNITDPAGDVSPACRIDFITASVRPHKTKKNTLMFGFSSDFPINRSKLSYQLRLLLRIGDGIGANINGETFNYMMESPNKFFRFAGTKSNQWKWERIGTLPVRFTKQWCEIDLPLDMLPEKPKSIKFRISCERSDFIPDQRYQLPEYKLD